ncbi:MAG: hypothetical protein J3R72DRAFT_65445 [Linnemannia gamsii]|nr:MAG: hypothetical protein J3R72DRAFT_65445 [Linnemannia gamsii]
MRKKGGQERHPLCNAAIPNTFYFTTNKPEQYDAAHYFKTFADLHSSKKEVLHAYWMVVLDILEDCNIRNYQSHGQRLKAVWNTPSRGLGDFWDRVQEKESDREHLRTITSVLKRRALRSAGTNTLKAFNAVDRNLSFDDDHDESTPRRKRQGKGTNKTNQDMGNGKTSALSGATGDWAVAGMPQLMEEQDDVDGDPFVDAYGFEGALSESAAATPSKMFKSPRPTLRPAAATSPKMVRSSKPTRATPTPSKMVRSSKPTGATPQPMVAALDPMPAIYYLAGGGDSDCSKECRSPYVVNAIDVSDILWTYRSEILEKAEQMEYLESVERLVVNNIYLFEQGDSKSSLFHALGAKHWSTITKNTLQTRVTKAMLSEIGMKAVEISRMTHEDAQEHVDSTASNKEIRRLLTSLLEDNFLWDKADFNELELLQNLFNPFLKTFFGGMPSCKGRWDKEFEPSKDRRQMDDPNAKGRRPDYFMELILPGLTCYLMVLEAKKSRQTSSTQTDMEKVANLLKDSIDYLARAAVDVSNIKLFGLVIVEKATVYTMNLAAKGVYIMKTYALFYVPRSKDDLAVIGTAMDVLMNMKPELELLISQCEAPRSSCPSDRTTTSYRTPQKVERTGVPVVRPTSPSIRAATNRA